MRVVSSSNNNSTTTTTEVVSYLYTEDVVRRIQENNNSEEILGVVQKVGGEEDDSDDDNEFEELEKGKCAVLWSNGKYTTETADDLEVIDRSFLHGDVVAYSSSPFAQSGTVVDVQLYTDLKVYRDLSRKTFDIVRNLPSSFLTPLHRFKLGNFAVFDEKWLCRIQKVAYELTVQLPDGSRCTIDKPDPDELLESTATDDSYPFFPGQTLVFDTSQGTKLLRNAKWLQGAYKRNMDKRGVVLAVKPTSVELEYISSKIDEEMPEAETTQLKKLKLFQYYRYTAWEIGDNGYIGKNVVEATEEERKQMTPKPLDLNNSNSIRIAQVMGTRTLVDVVWQDGSKTSNIESTSLIPLHHLGDTEYWPEDYVALKTEGEATTVSSDKVGVILSVNSKERTCKVKWLKGAPAESATEELSVYEIEAHQDYEYRLGDVVIRLPGNESESKTWAGEVIGIEGEFIHVCWIGGAVEKIRYDEVMNVNKISHDEGENDEDFEEDDEEEEEDEENIVAPDIYRAARNGSNQLRVGGEDDNWEAISDEGDEAEEDDDDEYVTEEEEGGENENNEDNASDSDAEESAAPSVPSVNNGVLQLPTDLINRVLDINASTNERGETLIGYNPAYRPTSYIGEDGEEVSLIDKVQQEEEEKKKLSQASTSAPTPSSSSSEATTQTTTATTSQQQSTSSVEPGTDNYLGLPKFELVEDVKDHFFASKVPTNNKGFARTAQKEWKLLKENLPDGVYVKAYESRLDLFRAIIIGPKATPYYDGVFVFDIYLPPEYPTSPPKVHFWSFGEKINPNLYNDGKVCLSLLGTWEGRESCEVWNPSKSNLLQLVLSFMGLILNSEPYYNEAGYSAQIGTEEGKHNSAIYNENALLLTLTHMTASIKHPPAYTETIIRKHFEKRHKAVVERLEGYLTQSNSASEATGTTLGPTSSKIEPDDQGILQRPSTGFLRSLKTKLAAFKAATERLK